MPISDLHTGGMRAIREQPETDVIVRKRVIPRFHTKGCIEGPQPFDFHSAGGDMRVAEERLKAASYIGF